MGEENRGLDDDLGTRGNTGGHEYVAIEVGGRNKSGEDNGIRKRVARRQTLQEIGLPDLSTSSNYIGRMAVMADTLAFGSLFGYLVYQWASQ
jgi:hypothetical protein